MAKRPQFALWMWIPTWCGSIIFGGGQWYWRGLYKRRKDAERMSAIIKKHGHFTCRAIERKY